MGRVGSPLKAAAFPFGRVSPWNSSTWSAPGRFLCHAKVVRKEVGKKASRSTTHLALSATQTQHMGHVSPSALNFSLKYLLKKMVQTWHKKVQAARQGRNVCLICSKPAIKNNHIVAGLPADLCFSFPSVFYAALRFAVPAGPEWTCSCFDCDPWAFWAAPLPTGAPCQSSGPSGRCLGSRPARIK